MRRNGRAAIWVGCSALCLVLASLAIRRDHHALRQLASIITPRSRDAGSADAGNVPASEMRPGTAIDAGCPAPDAPPGSRGQFERVLAATDWPASNCGINFTGFVVLDDRVIVAWMDRAFYVDATSPTAVPFPGFFEGMPFPKRPVGLALRELGYADADLDLIVTACDLEVGHLGLIPPWLPAHVRGRPGRWRKGPDASVPGWPPKGLLGAVGTLDEIAVGSAALGGDRYHFVDHHPSGRAVQRPAAGRDGCAQAMLGHGAMHYLPDGTLVGVGTLCRSARDPLTFLPLDTIHGYAYFTPGPGPLGVEIWGGNASGVFPLPGAERSGGTLVRIAGSGKNDIWLDFQGLDSAGEKRPYVAHFDGHTWEIMTPPRATRELALLFSPRLAQGTLLFLDPPRSYRAIPGRLDPLRCPTSDHATRLETIGSGTSRACAWGPTEPSGSAMGDASSRSRAAPRPQTCSGSRTTSWSAASSSLGDIPVVHTFPSGDSRGGSVYRWRPRDRGK